MQLAPATGDQRELLVNLAIAPFRQPDRREAGWILVIADVTDRASLEEQLRLSEKMAAIGLLAAGVAHEVNTPLTGISSFTQMLLERSEAEDPRRELLEKIERQTFRAAKIVNNLLNLARPSDRGSGACRRERHRRRRAVAARASAPNEPHSGAPRAVANRPSSCRAIEYKLQQVFLNLFLNARDAMPKGGWLTVATRADGGDVVVEVADTGVGIPPEHLARIYDPFFTTKAEGRGTGLGLSVTYGIVQEHGGTLSCESDDGQGTRFRLVLPLLDAPDAATGQASRGARQAVRRLKHDPDQCLHPRHRRRGDHPRSARRAADRRRATGCRLRRRRRQGLEALGSRQVDAVLLDLDAARPQRHRGPRRHSPPGR